MRRKPHPHRSSTTTTNHCGRVARVVTGTAARGGVEPGGQNQARTLFRRADTDDRTFARLSDQEADRQDPRERSNSPRSSWGAHPGDPSPGSRGRGSSSICGASAATARRPGRCRRISAPPPTSIPSVDHEGRDRILKLVRGIQAGPRPPRGRLPTKPQHAPGGARMWRSRP